MKILLVLCLVSIVLFPLSYGQQGEIICKVASESQVQVTTTVGEENLAVVLVDFPEGRIYQSGQYLLPTVDSDTNYFTTNNQINAVGGMGYVFKNPLNPSEGLRKKIRKYVYDDYWDWIFSDSPTFTGTRHPDYNSHGSEVTTYGSLKDYYKEVSYNNLTIVPAQTWNGTSDRYHTGIINAIDEANGNKYVRWIKMPNAKSAYYRVDPPQNGPLAEVISELQNLKSTGAIDFDVNSYDGKILIIVAGGGPGGQVNAISGNLITVREKKYQNYESQSTLDGIFVMVHEYGHTLGFAHIASSTLDPMVPTLNNSWGGHLFSPQHFNPIFKLQKGWFAVGDAVNISSSMSLSLPSITSSSKKVGLVTIYGDAGRDGDYEHSEYFALEYRTRDGFNRFAGGINAPGFSGGVLIWHYSKYGEYEFHQGDIPQSSPIGLKLKYFNGSNYANYCDANNYTTFERDLGSPIHFFYSGNNNLSPSTSPTNTNSGVHLWTGITLSNFSVSNNLINVNVNYAEAVPTYTSFYKTFSYLPTTISGNVYIEDKTAPAFFTTISNGSTITIAPNASLGLQNITSIATQPDNIKLHGAGFGAYHGKWLKKLTYPELLT